MTFSERVKATELPLDQLVVIGSGLLDQLNIRPASDIDLVVSEKLFADLVAEGSYRAIEKHGELCLERPPLEIWQSWGSGGVPNFTELYQEGQTVDEVRYVATKTLLEQKKLRNLPKDKDDITLLEGYNEKYGRE